MSSVRETVAGVLKKSRREIPSGFLKCGPCSLTDWADLTAFGDDRPTAYAAVIPVPSYAFAISADLPSFRYDSAAADTGIFHSEVSLKHHGVEM